MTKFILLGGYLSKAQDGGKSFAEELVKEKSSSPKILLCLFARLHERWDEIFTKESEAFKAYLPDKDLQLQLAQYDSFIEQVQWADAIFLRGGSSEELIKALQERSGWTKYLEGKTVAGSSAGMDALSKYYYGLDTLQVREGLGLLQIKSIPHFKSDYHGWEFDWDKAKEELKNYKEDLPIVALGEGEFKTFER